MDKFEGRLTRDGIRIHNPSDFDGMRKAGALAARILDDIALMVEPGVTTEAIDAEIERRVNAAGATSATIGYKGYQHASCISINHVVCHGIPGPKTLKNGDILNIDVTVIVDGCGTSNCRANPNGGSFAAARVPVPGGPIAKCTR